MHNQDDGIRPENLVWCVRSSTNVWRACETLLTMRRVYLLSLKKSSVTFNGAPVSVSTTWRTDQQSGLRNQMEILQERSTKTEI